MLSGQPLTRYFASSPTLTALFCILWSLIAGVHVVNNSYRSFYLTLISSALLFVLFCILKGVHPFPRNFLPLYILMGISLILPIPKLAYPRYYLCGLLALVAIPLAIQHKNLKSYLANPTGIGVAPTSPEDWKSLMKWASDHADTPLVFSSVPGAGAHYVGAGLYYARYVENFKKPYLVDQIDAFFQKKNTFYSTRQFK